jgi:hypothetical protein
MKAMRLADSGATAVLVEENVPQPQPGRGAYTGKQSKDAAVENWSLRWWQTTVPVRTSNCAGVV